VIGIIGVLVFSLIACLIQNNFGGVKTIVVYRTSRIQVSEYRWQFIYVGLVVFSACTVGTLTTVGSRLIPNSSFFACAAHTGSAYGVYAELKCPKTDGIACPDIAGI